MQSKLSRLLDFWFNGLGFEAIGRITGIVTFNTEDIDATMQEAFATWKLLRLSEQLTHYQNIGFQDHQYFTEKEFLNAVTIEL